MAYSLLYPRDRCCFLQTASCVYVCCTYIKPLFVPKRHHQQTTLNRYLYPTTSSARAASILIIFPNASCDLILTQQARGLTLTPSTLNTEYLAFRLGVQMSTDCGVEGIIINIRKSPSDDSRKRLFELATSNSRTYFTASQARVRAPSRCFVPLTFNVQLQC